MKLLKDYLKYNKGKNPKGFDYGFNLEYGKKHTAENPLIASIRRILDQETEMRYKESNSDS